MLGLGSSVSKTSKRSTANPLRIPNLVGWWDFTDASTMYSDDGSTRIANGEAIEQISNKAYRLQNSTHLALGAFLQQGTSGRKPLWSSDNGGFATFDGSDDNMICKKIVAQGAVATDKLSDTTLNATGMTIFFVAESAASGAVISEDAYLIHGKTTSSANHRFSVYVDDNSTTDRWQYHIQDDSGRTNTLGNCGRNLTNDKELWTVHLDSTSANSIYLNNSPPLGISNGNSTNTDYDFSLDNVNVSFCIGGNDNNNNFKGKVYQVLIYDRALSTAEQVTVNKYLIQRNKI
tara:strand:+ start:649 stop:1518 length:870 start_codon:yes stop_codon:yes gene_type:complete